MRLTVDHERCTLCGACLLTCPTDMVRRKEDRIKIGHVACIACGHCVAVCPEEAIRVTDPGFEGAFEPLAAPGIDPMALAALLKSRRTVRRYEPEPIPRETLEALFDAARWAPSGANCQCAEFAVITSEQAKAALRERLTAYWRRYAEALADRENRDARLAELGADRDQALHPHVLAAVPALIKNIDAGRDRLFFDAPAVVVCHAARDAVLPHDGCLYATMYLVLLAEAYGLGSCLTAYASEALRALPEARAELGIPETNQVYSTVVLGRPAETFHRIPAREPAKVTWL